MARENLASEAEVGRKRKREKLAEQDFVTDLREVMNLKAGRAFVRALLIQSGFGHKTFDPDPRMDAYSQGQQNLGRWLIANLREHAFREYRLMEDEERRDAKIEAVPPEQDEQEIVNE